MEAQFERNENRREAVDERAYNRLGRQLAAADVLIGQFVGGAYYINVLNRRGHMTGAVRRFAHKTDAQHYLIRNRYV